MQYYDEKEKRFLPYLEGLPATQLVVSPDQKWIVYTDYPRGYLWRCKTDGSEKLQLTDSSGADAHVVARQQVDRVFRLE